MLNRLETEAARAVKEQRLRASTLNSENSGGSASVVAEASRQQGGKRMTIDQRMKLVLFEKSESSGWSITEFQSELKCSRGGIHKTPSWKWNLAQALTERGAIVKTVRLPNGPPDTNGKPTKIGLDDFLVAHSANELRVLLKAALPPIKPVQLAPISHVW